MIRDSTPKSRLYKIFAYLIIVGLMFFGFCYVALWIMYLLTGAGGPIYGDLLSQQILENLSLLGIVITVIGLTGWVSCLSHDWLLHRREQSDFSEES